MKILRELLFISAADDETESDAPPSSTPKSAKLVGGTFFPPDFNVEAFRGNYLQVIKSKCIKKNSVVTLSIFTWET